MSALTREECDKTHEANDKINRYLIASVVFLFLGLGGVYMWSVDRFASHDDVSRMRTEWREDMREIKTDLKQLLRGGDN